ncbi:MAG: hypothetical protein LBQ88_06665 [Treponema sp.]|jgi:hypothetical protein|nr:hypothetical protein [Treponema sp.]
MDSDLNKALAKEQQRIEEALRGCGYTIETIQFAGPYGLNIPRLVINARSVEEKEERYG